MTVVSQVPRARSGIVVSKAAQAYYGNSPKSGAAMDAMPASGDLVSHRRTAAVHRHRSFLCAKVKTPMARRLSVLRGKMINRSVCRCLQASAVGVSGFSPDIWDSSLSVRDRQRTVKNFEREGGFALRALNTTVISYILRQCRIKRREALWGGPLFCH